LKLAVIIFLLAFYFGPLNAQPHLKKLSFDEFSPYLHNQNDTLYIINFWATWCDPCVQEIPAFEKIWRDYNKGRIRIILVSLDIPAQIETRLIPFLKDHSISSDVIVLDDPDSNRWIDKVSPDWTGSIPATLVYNSTEREFYERSFTYNELRSIINSKIN
jgi:thiol-disulfide isomerase/thioredoxin